MEHIGRTAHLLLFTRLMTLLIKYRQCSKGGGDMNCPYCNKPIVEIVTTYNKGTIDCVACLDLKASLEIGRKRAIRSIERHRERNANLFSEDEC